MTRAQSLELCLLRQGQGQGHETLDLHISVPRGVAAQSSTLELRRAAAMTISHRSFPFLLNEIIDCSQPAMNGIPKRHYNLIPHYAGGSRSAKMALEMRWLRDERSDERSHLGGIASVRLIRSEMASLALLASLGNAYIRTTR